MISLYIVRHGETMHNLENRVQGHTDSPLTDLGKRQVSAIADKLASEKFTTIYSSDLGRARTTAEVIASRHNLPVHTTSLLREACLGVIQGLTQAEFAEKYPEEYRKWKENSAENRPPGAEKLEEVIERCRQFLTEITEKHQNGEKLLAAVHGGSVRGLICAAFNLPPTFYRNIHTANASLSILDIGNRPALRLLNDTCHLQGLKITEEDSDNLPIYRT